MASLMPDYLREYYQPGDVIYQGNPFMKVIRHDLWNTVCAHCLENGYLRYCQACRIMKYCGRDCQKKAWPDHKLECPLLPTYNNFTEQPLVQMIGNIILKIKGKDWSSVTERIMGTEVSFDDLVSHTNRSNLPKLMIKYNLVKEPLKSYIGQENFPSEETLLELTGKVIYNQTSFKRDNTLCHSWGFFIGLSMFNTCCVPNSNIVYNGKILALRAAKPINKKKEKVTFSNRCMVVSIDTPYLYKDMNKSTFDDCKCIDCSKPYGTSALTKILNYSNASSVIDETEAILQLTSLLPRLNYPPGIVTRRKLRLLLEKQKGVLGRTHLLHMQTLAAKSLFMEGPKEERRVDLMELADAMKEVWGANFEELSVVYEKLLDINEKLKNVEAVAHYKKMISDLNAVC